jgi:hypothetical protein
MQKETENQDNSIFDNTQEPLPRQFVLSKGFPGQLRDLIVLRKQLKTR